MADLIMPGKGRLEAFSDGVIAIIITIMVLELEIPEVLAHGFDLHALVDFVPRLLAYALSFLVIAVYWMNHHSLTHALHGVNRAFLWLNNLLLFCLSLVPMATRFFGAHPESPIATSIYGLTLACCATSITLMRSEVCRHETDPEMIALHGRIVRKSLVGIAIYVSSAPLGFVAPPLAWLCFMLPPAMFFLPDVRARG